MLVFVLHLVLTLQGPMPPVNIQLHALGLKKGGGLRWVHKRTHKCWGFPKNEKKAKGKKRETSEAKRKKGKNEEQKLLRVNKKGRGGGGIHVMAFQEYGGVVKRRA